MRYFLKYFIRSRAKSFREDCPLVTGLGLRLWCLAPVSTILWLSRPRRPLLYLEKGRVKEYIKLIIRKVRRYRRGNQNPYIEEEQTTQWPKEKVQKDKQRSKQVLLHWRTPWFFHLKDNLHQDLMINSLCDVFTVGPQLENISEPIQSLS